MRDVSVDLGDGSSIAIVRVEFENKDGRMVSYDRVQRVRPYGVEGKELCWDQKLATVPDDILAQALIYGMTGEDLVELAAKLDQQIKKYCT